MFVSLSTRGHFWLWGALISGHTNLTHSLLYSVYKCTVQAMYNVLRFDFSGLYYMYLHYYLYCLFL